MLTASLSTAACGSSSGTNNSTGGAGGAGGAGAGGTGGGQAGSGGTNSGTVHTAAGVTITEVAIYQGPKRTVMADGKAVDSDVPLIAGRPGIVRVFYSTDSSYSGKPVTFRLTLDEGPPRELNATLGDGASDENLQSTANFEIAADDLGETLKWSVDVVEAGEGDDNPKARFPDTGAAELKLGKKNTFRIKIVPFKYDADGSGRLPDLSESRVEEIRNRFKALYPVTDVELSVNAPVPWTNAIDPNGNGWEQVGIRVFGEKSNNGDSPDVYYYGMFNPRASAQQFCSQGCLLGVTLLNNSPPDVGNPMLRLALGVGFDMFAADTAAHEIGHAHGREHANCGPGLDPGSIDQSFPHAGGKIGVWGYDITTSKLQPPTASDIMGYCPNPFISDHNYTALYNRGKNVNLPSITGGPAAYDIYSLDGDGHATHLKRYEPDQPVFGRKVDVSVTEASGAVRAARGEYFAWDHLPGGWLFVPRGESPLGGMSPQPKTIEAVVSGTHYR